MSNTHELSLQLTVENVGNITSSWRSQCMAKECNDSSEREDREFHGWLLESTVGLQVATSSVVNRRNLYYPAPGDRLFHEMKIPFDRYSERKPQHLSIASNFLFSLNKIYISHKPFRPTIPLAVLIRILGSGKRWHPGVSSRSAMALCLQTAYALAAFPDTCTQIQCYALSINRRNDGMTSTAHLKM